MRFRKVIEEPLDHSEDGVDIAGGINAVIDVNAGEHSSSSSVSSKQSIKVVQRGGRTHVEKHTETSGSDEPSRS